MAEQRKSKVVTNAKEIEALAKLTADDITTSFIMDNFGDFGKGPKYNPFDIVTMPKGCYGPDGKKNKNEFTTTVGLWVYNKYFIEQDLFDVFGYVSEPITKKVNGKMVKIISHYVLEDKLPISTMDRFLMKQQKFMPYVDILAYNYSEKMLTCTRVINKKKSELLKKYKADIEAGDPIVGDKMEKELLDFALDYMKDDPSMDMFLSGARGTIGNNFKNMFVMKGVIKDPDPNAKQKYKVAMSNYIDGISPDEYALFANTLAAGPYARSKKTQNGGYLEKLFLWAFQHVVLLDAGSDCGTTRTINMTINSDTVDSCMYMYVVDGNKTVELTTDVVDKYMGKTVKLRYPSMCKAPAGKICNKCMGNLPYRLNIKNIGPSTTQVASIMKNVAMKAFHDSTQQLYDMDLNMVFK